jgi:transposase
MGVPLFEKTGGRDVDVRRRRNWTKVAKGRVVAAMLSPGANISEIARQHEVSRQHLYLWRKAAFDGELPLYPPKLERAGTPITAGRAPSSQTPCALEVEVAGFVVRAPPGADIDFLTQIVSSLKILI